MTIRSYRWIAVALGLASSAGCGGITDGGPVGTGITASVVGNVVAVEDPEVLASLGITASVDDGATDAVANVEGIEVSLAELPGVSTATDAEGNFNLEGDFAGSVTLRFRTTELEAEQALDVPSGGVVVLSDIQLASDGITAEAGRQLALEGSVRSVDCEAAELVVEDRRGERFDVSLIDETEVVRDGLAGACADLRPGTDVAIDGLFGDGRGRSLVALVITLGPGSSGPPPIERRVAFVGDVVAADCATGSLLIHDGAHGVRVRLEADTMIRNGQGDLLTCEELVLGDRVTGDGRLNLTRPGFVQGRLLVVGRRLGPGAELPIRGLVAATACDRDVLLIALEGAIVSVRILPDTRRHPANATCQTVSRGSWWVRGKGLVSAEIPGGLDATNLEFRRVQPRR